MRICNTCKTEKPLTEFYKGQPRQCKDCKESTRLKKLYGITKSDYNRLFAEQDGACKICGTHQCKTKKSLAVDHCHETGVVRGLLCSNCNTALGKLNDNPELFERAARYLREEDQR